MAHTNGPWHVNGNCIEADAPDAPRDITVAVVAGALFNKTAIDNARLIAAAPDLLAACRALRNCLADWVEIADEDDERDDDREALALADRTIKAAQGGTDDQ